MQKFGDRILSIARLVLRTRGGGARIQDHSLQGRIGVGSEKEWRHPGACWHGRRDHKMHDYHAGRLPPLVNHTLKLAFTFLQGAWLNMSFCLRRVAFAFLGSSVRTTAFCAS